MTARARSANSALIEESRNHIARLQALIEDSRGESRLALELIDQSTRYIEQVEEIEASRIEGRANEGGEPLR